MAKFEKKNRLVASGKYGFWKRWLGAVLLLDNLVWIIITPRVNVKEYIKTIE